VGGLERQNIRDHFDHSSAQSVMSVPLAALAVTILAGEPPDTPGELPKIAQTYVAPLSKMSTCDTTWDCAALAKAVCDTLVADGKLKEKPAFIRTDREAKIAKIFEGAKLDGAAHTHS